MTKTDRHFDRRSPKRGVASGFWYGFSPFGECVVPMCGFVLCLLDCEFLSFHDVDALWQALACFADGCLREDECALCVVDIDGGVFLLEFVDAGFYVFETGDVLDFECGCAVGLLVPCEAASCGQECFAAIGADEYALEDVGVLLCGYAVASFGLECFP